MKIPAPLPAAILCGLLSLCAPAFGESVEPIPDISLEELLNTEVISASRKMQSLKLVPAAVFVISREDIARSGARSLADALAMAPGIEVARLGNNRWAVTARGYNGRFANKLQVLKDGRSIYSPPFSSVFWEAEDGVLEDIDHIEVVRGPNAALWGANAVNGTINIVTRKARDTQGSLVAAETGSEDRINIVARYGTALGDSGHMRIYGKAVDRRAGFTADGGRAADTSETRMAGLRADWLLSSGNRLSLNGEAYRSRNMDTFNVPAARPPAFVTPFASMMAMEGGHLQGRYESLRDDGSEIVFQSYFSRRKMEVQWIAQERRDTLDLDFQYRFAPCGAHDVMLGANYRSSADAIDTTTYAVQFVRKTVDFRLGGAFINDEITLVPDRFRVTLGARLEHNTTSGTDLQPTARFLWTPNAAQALWGALSHATRTPSRAETDISLPLLVLPPTPATGFLPVLVYKGSHANNVTASEKMDAAELGYRHRFGPDFSVDAAFFAHRYRDGVTIVPGNPVPALDPIPHLLLPLNSVNGERSRLHGFELGVFAQPDPAWRLKLAYGWIKGVANGLGDPYSEALAQSEMNKMPRHQLSLRSQHDIGRMQQLDFWLKFKSRTRFEATATPVDVPARANLDVRYAWKPSRALEISAVGQNLLHRQSFEYLPDQLPSAPVEIGRGFYLRAEYRF